MKTVTNLVLGTLLAAALIGPVAGAAPDQAMRTGISVAAGDLGVATKPVSISTMVRVAFARAL